MNKDSAISTPAIKHLEWLAKTFKNSGNPFDVGIPEEDAHAAFKKARDDFPDKNIVTVKYWCWWDVYLDEDDLEIGSKPNYSMLKSDEIIESNHWNSAIKPGNWVRSSELKTFHHGCAIFETASSCYILVGPGTRKPVNAREALPFFQVWLDR